MYHQQHEDEILLISDQINWAPLGCLLSIGFFFVSSAGLSKIIPEKVTSQGAESVWKYKNVGVSFIHSFITGLGSLLSLYLYPNLAENVISSYAGLAHILATFTTGYFIYDFYDMYCNFRKRSTYELLLHHVFAISCFAIPAFSRYFMGFSMIGLLIEVNSFFLHWRQLLLFQGTPKIHMSFRIVSLLNVFSFIVFRLVNVGWMIKWVSRNRENISLGTYILGVSALSTVLVMSIVLFIRVLRSDYFKSQPTMAKAKSKGKVM